MIGQHGQWRLTLIGEKEKVKAVTVVRSLLDLDLQTAGRMMRDKDLVLWSGTEVECMWLAKQLKRHGIEASVEKLDVAKVSQPA
jgi:hypothetical protein